MISPSQKHHRSSCCEGRSLFEIHLLLVIREREEEIGCFMCNTVSVFIFLSPGGYDTVLSCLLFKMENTCIGGMEEKGN